MSPPWRLVTLSIVALLFAAGLAALYFTKSPNTPVSNNARAADFGQTISVNGRIVCLPHKDKTGPQTEECAIGLEGDDSYFYGLKDLSQEQLINGTLSTQTRITAQGVLEAPAANDRYDIVGTINVDSVTVINSQN